LESRKSSCSVFFSPGTKVYPVTNKSINIWTGLQDKENIFAFPEERQKPSSLFKGRRSTIVATKQKSK